MTWYRVYFGTWHDSDGVKQVLGTFNRKEAFAKARKVANDLGTIVTILHTRGTKLGFDLVKPE